MKRKSFKNHESQFITHDKRKLDIIWNSGLLKYNEKIEILSIGTDITERKLLEEKLKEAAYYDNLTGLYNRNMIEEEVKKRIENKEEFALVYMDIDNFKQVNDTLGHSARINSSNILLINSEVRLNAIIE